MNQNSPTLSLVQQIRAAITNEIETGALKKNQRLWSINSYSRQFKVARDTIEKAYIALKKDGDVAAVSGKGYFVTGKRETHLRILLLFNKLSSYKKIVYDAIVTSLDGYAKVDLAIHHYSPALLEEIINIQALNYHYLVVMPHFTYDSDPNDYFTILSMIPQNKLILLDRQLPSLHSKSTIYQDFELDIDGALSSVKHQTAKYTEVLMIFACERHHPKEIIKGAQKFSRETQKKFV